MEDGATPIIFFLGVIQSTLNLPDWKSIIYDWQIFVPIFVVGYIIGSIPFGLITTKLSGLGDIRKIGSGNIGATNVLRTGKVGLALLTLLLDTTKGFLVVFISQKYCGPDATFYVSLLVVLGHMFPIWLKLRGGKGVATFFGVLFALSPTSAIVVLAIWIIVALAFRYSSLAALISVSFAPLFGHFLSDPQIGSILTILAILIWIRHINNLRNLFKGNERKINVNLTTHNK
ncbi:MAG: acyl-phosphate glycerol 3-phosphate acyltransferase [Alphaproteobacteria bacterium]|jgi:glycerol-3-phosphate acyltransferase PlsY|nr:acyl-phosphate glycerol 3-phosphate acyltransferase [Alphaproteobacteria bacterium]PPR13490.1 MAG: putative glycerol-3-phosphate acyltransferase [Alphaproteobacteria bacterium MarineAlpha12_Bin1]|tara:strand:+ start:31983 stop:32675 length:693 start_codon:yes stop_codon:yes gene_type:complete